MILFQVLALAVLAVMVLADWYWTLRRGGNWLGVFCRTAVWLLAGGFILFPDSLTSIANFLGIHRGADILLYSVTLAFLAVSFFLYARIVQLRRQMTLLVRHLALAQAIAPDPRPLADSLPCSPSPPG